MGHPGNTFCNLFHLHLDDLILQVFSLTGNLGVQDFHRIWLLVRANLFSQEAYVIRDLFGGVRVEGLQVSNLLVNRDHLLVLGQILLVVKDEAEAFFGKAEVELWLLFRHRFSLLD